MGEVLEKESGRRRSRKAARLDMTPMVDLAFLLLTFFMLTATFAKPVVMPLAMPVKDHKTPEMPLRPANALTIYLGAKDQVYYLDGLADEPRAQVVKSSFSARGLRQHILRRRQENIAYNQGKLKLFVLIKPLRAARYKNIVDVLDELNIAEIGTYALVNDFTAGEKKLLREKIGAIL